MKKSIGFSIAAIILTVLYGMLCVGIFTNTGLVYNLYGVVIQDWHADAPVYISLYVQTFLNAALVLLFAVGALLGNPGTENKYQRADTSCVCRDISVPAAGVQYIGRKL